MHQTIGWSNSRTDTFDQGAKSWDEAISETVAQWEDDPSSTFDDDYPTPARSVMNFARWAAHTLKAEGVDAPLRIVPTADGGIVFEWETYPTFESLTIHPDLSLDRKFFEFGSLIRRRRSQGPVIAGADDDAAW